MDQIVSKWGNSLGLRIPAAVAKMVGLSEGAPVRLSVRQGRLIVDPVPCELDKLLAGVTEENKHEPVEVGAPKGREVW